MKQGGGDVQQLDDDGNIINADGIDFPTMTQTQIQDQLNMENNNNNQDQVNLIKQLQATDSEIFGGMLAKGGRRSIQQAGFTSPEELDENMRKHKEAQKRLRRKRIELEKKKQQRLMAERAEQEMLRQNIEKNEERRKRIQEEHEAERKRLLAERVASQKREREQRREEREKLLKKEKKLKKIKKKPLYKRMEDEYNERILMPELIRRKERLAAIHKRFKESSPALSDIDMHQRAIQAQERLNRERSRLKRRGREKVWNQSKTYYTGKTKMSILEEQRKNQTKEQLKLREKKLIRAKQKAYGEFVRKQVAPKIDPDKMDEVKERISKLKNPAPLRKEMREKETLNAVIRMEPQRPSGDNYNNNNNNYSQNNNNNNYHSLRVKQELQNQLLKEQEELEQPSHRMRTRNETLETARFLNAKEQAKEDMRIRRERRRQKQLQQRGVNGNGNTTTITNNNNNNKRSNSNASLNSNTSGGRRRQQQHQQSQDSFALPIGNDNDDGDDDGNIMSGRIIEDAEQHAKLSNMYMQAMQAKMQELEQLGDDE